ncbi:type IV pilus modification PilV family protein [Clostridium sp.]|jgi:prepilin-type N-terminal cleavage/methylation domain-containing protein|uniref:type IV pilus modification PilV family protein n=1 Tax=Clostridium sp. TaxID=1506 RepID=UPI003EEB1C3B
MLKLRSDKGFTLVEVICSLGIFSILFISVMSYDITSSKIKNTIKDTNNNVFILETIKNNMIYAMTFQELEVLKRNDRVFINSGNMTLPKIKQSTMNVFSEDALTEKPYVKLDFLKYELNVYTLRLALYDDNQSDIPSLQCNFYKGNYYK